MKKKLALLLSACLVAQTVFVVPGHVVRAEETVSEELVEEVSDESVEEVEDTIEQPAQSVDITEPTVESEETIEEPVDVQEQEVIEEVDVQEQETTEEVEVLDIKGSITLRMISGLFVNAEQVFQVSLDGPTIATQTITLPNLGQEDAAASSEIEFPDLESGNYQITITGAGYVPYVQQIEVGAMDYQIQVYTGNVAGFEAERRPGVIAYGDVNLDGILDEADASQIVDVIEGVYENDLSDLNKDGVVNLIDLQYFTEYYEGFEAIQSTVEAYIPEEVITVEAQGTTLIGELENVWAEEGVTLTPINGTDISEENPVEIQFTFAKTQEPIYVEGFTVQAPKAMENGVQEGTIFVEYEDEQGNLQGMEVPISAISLARAGGPTAEVAEDGSIRVNFGGQIAVKKVTIKVTKTNSGGSLAEISKVEFVNDMEKHIPQPEMDIPENLAVTTGSKEFTIQWSPARNVTGYEVSIQCDGVEEVKKTSTTTLFVKSFQQDELVNKKEYVVKVRSINGDWRSPYSESVVAVPKADKKPDAPDNVSVTGKYRSLAVTWKDMDDTDSYNVFYREDGVEEFTKIEGITQNSYTISGLKDQTKYIVYVTGVNELGEGAASLEATGTTVNVQPAQLPAYKLLNTFEQEGVLSDHIVLATPGRGTMVDSSLDEGNANSALGLFDNDYTSYWLLKDWDEGAAYPGNTKGITTTFDDYYELGMISFAEIQDTNGWWYSGARVDYWDENGTQKTVNTTVSEKTGENGRKYYIVKFSEPIKTNKIKLGIRHPYGNMSKMEIAEIRYHLYDSLEQDIMDLYADALHLTLKDEVTQDKIQELQKRLDTVDSVSGEYHPFRDALQKELDAAKQLLETQGLQDVLQIHSAITMSKSTPVGGLNAWQPLGVTAAAGEEVVIYVGAEGAKTGAATPLKLVASQQHAESNAPAKTVLSLKVGRNEITIPELSSVNAEHGGALYIEYTGNNLQDNYAVRVSGGTKIPVLDLYGITDANERTARIEAYVEEVNTYVSKIEDEHTAQHQSGSHASVDFAYDDKTCILNTTDILLDQMMISIPASQVVAGIGSGTQAVERLSKSLTAMDEMLILFYQHKGLTNSFAEGTAADVIAKNSLPSAHLNIRYMKMFAGAFMYAAGNHIGIEWSETTGMVTGTPVSIDSDGKKVSGSYFGWGIAHEIGHQINQGQYTIAEITNNYFSVLAQADETNDGVRFKYADVYEKVTSGAIGRSDNVFTQLGMYWQLHLAYDRGYNYRTYANYQEIFDNIFFARVDSYARDTSKAPAPNGIGLTLGNDVDQNLMQLAAAAAEKDLTEFFVRWGMVPNEATAAYMKQFAAEERAIYYVNDEARAYEIENGTSQTIAGQDIVTAQMTAEDSSVTFAIQNTASSSDVILGYEITRSMISNGQVERQVVGFTTDGKFIDQISSVSNRVITYEITAIDKFLNRSAVHTMDPVKIMGDGTQDKTNWTIQTNMSSEQDSLPDADVNDPCAPEEESAAYLMIDGDKSTTYTGTSKEDPQITISMNQFTEVTALRYALKGDGNPISDYRIEVSKDGVEYQTIREGAFTLKDGTQILYFPNQDGEPWINTYDALYLRVTAVGQAGKEISVSELDILGPTGDDINFLESSQGVSIGVLEQDYVYQEAGEEMKIPQGSIVFTGTYKGNPAYNVVLLYDKDGNIVGGQDAEGNILANQIILAPNPGNAELGEVSEGAWVYWIEPDTMQSGVTLPSQVRAELYRVDNAMTNEGQRLVSDTYFVDIPTQLPNITLSK